MSPTPSPVAVITGTAGNIGACLLQRFTDEDGVRAAFATIVDHAGRIDVLVDNAGISAIGRFEDHDLATHRRVMEVNYLGSVACTQAALPQLRRTGGSG